MPLTKRANSIKAGRKWKRCGKVMKHLLLASGGSNKKPVIDYIKEYFKNDEV